MDSETAIGDRKQQGLGRFERFLALCTMNYGEGQVAS